MAATSLPIHERRRARYAAWRRVLDRLCRDVVYFTQRVIWIESKSETGEAVIRFRLWPEQVRALQTFLDNRLVIVLKARQLGLTWLALSYALWRMLFNPGFTVVVLSKTEPDAIELVEYRLATIILPRLPRWLIRPYEERKKGWTGLAWSATKHVVMIHHPLRVDADGRVVRQPPSRLIARPASRHAGRSFTANLVILDEWAFQQWAREIWAAAYPTINRAGASVMDGQVIGISTAERDTLFEEVWNNAPDNGFFPLFLPYTTDPTRDVAWYEHTKKALPASYMREYPRTPEEAFSAGPRTAFPMFDPTPGGAYVCRPFRIPDWWLRWRANDPGYGDPFCWLWFAAAPDGRIFVYREFCRRPDVESQRLTYSEQAREVDRLSVVGTEAGGEPDVNPETGETVRERVVYTATGWDAFRTHPETGKNITDYYQEGGLSGFIEAPRDPAGRYGAVLEGFKVQDWPDNEVSEIVGRTTARVLIFETCSVLIEALTKLRTHEKRPNEIADSAWDHYFDALGYGLQTWHPNLSKAPQQPKSVVQKDKERRIKARTRARIRVL